MKAIIHLNNTTHKFEKSNLVTVKGGGDNYVCKCGLKGYRPAFADYINVTGKKALIEKACPLSDKKQNAKKVRITNFQGQSNEFVNLTCGSEHEVVECPENYKHKYAADVWVMGVTEPVRLLSGEYEKI